MGDLEGLENQTKIKIKVKSKLGWVHSLVRTQQRQQQEERTRRHQDGRHQVRPTTTWRHVCWSPHDARPQTQDSQHLEDNPLEHTFCDGQQTGTEYW